MATFNLRQFTRIETLKGIRPDRLLKLFRPYRDFLAERGLPLPDTANDHGLDYGSLMHVLGSCLTAAPQGLVDALYYIDEMSTSRGMDALLAAAEAAGVKLDDDGRTTPADVAIQAWLEDRDLLQTQHAICRIYRMRSFEYFQTDRRPLPDFKTPAEAQLQALKADLDPVFHRRRRGVGVQINAYPVPGGTCLRIRHGDPYRREGTMDEPGSVLYRPEKYDQVIYRPALGELAVHARSGWEKSLYQRKCGEHLFGDAGFFPGTAKYTLEPLRQYGRGALACVDVPGLELVTLREIHFCWPSEHGRLEIHKAEDVFDALQEGRRSFPARARITRAAFRVKFARCRTPRTVVICPSNVAQYARDADGHIIEQWLMARGFILESYADETLDTLLDVA